MPKPCKNTCEPFHCEVLQWDSVQQQDDHELSVFATWQTSYRQLSARAIQLLHIMSFFHHEGVAEAFFDAASARVYSFKEQIPLSTPQAATKLDIFQFLSSLRTSSDEWNPLAFKGLTSQLQAFSLLDYDPDSCSYSMHPLVQEWSRITAPDTTTVRECAAWVLALCVNNKFRSEDYAFRRQLLPHLLALDSDHAHMVPELADWLRVVYYKAGYDREYKALVEVALQGSRDSLGNEHPTTLTCMGNLAEAFHAQGRLEEAVLLLTELVEVNKRVHGHEHPDLLSSMHILALTYHDQERWQEAEALLLEVVEAKKRVIGAEHMDTLASMTMLASTYWHRDQLLEAEVLLVEVLEIEQRVFGREHPDTLVNMHSLAATYTNQGKLREAESLMEETVVLNKKVRGESHGST